MKMKATAPRRGPSAWVWSPKVVSSFRKKMLHVLEHLSSGRTGFWSNVARTRYASAR